MKGLSSFGIYVLGILNERKKHLMLNQPHIKIDLFLSIKKEFERRKIIDICSSLYGLDEDTLKLITSKEIDRGYIIELKKYGLISN